MGLRDLRQLAALSQAELAIKAGVSRPTVVMLEAGRTMPHPSTVRKLAAALGLPTAEIVRAIREDQEAAKIAA